MLSRVAQAGTAAPWWMPTAAITGPAGTSSFLTGSIFRFNPSSAWAPSRFMSPASANTTRSGASDPATLTRAYPTSRSMRRPSATMKPCFRCGMTPSSSSTCRGIHVYSLPVSTRVSGNARQEPCRSQFLISIVVRKRASVGELGPFLCGANRIYSGGRGAACCAPTIPPFPSFFFFSSSKKRARHVILSAAGAKDLLLPRYHRQHHVRGMCRVVQQPLVRHHERRVPLVIPAGVQIPVVLRKQRRRHTDTQPMARREHHRREPQVDVVAL